MRKSLNDTSVKGLCFPTRTGATIDRFRVLADHNRAERAQSLLAAGLKICNEENQKALLSSTLSSLKATATVCYSTLFATPVAYHDTDKLPIEMNGNELLANASRLFRHLCGHPAAADGVYVLPLSVLETGIYLPHLHATLKPQFHQIALVQSANTLKIIRIDGETLTLPNTALLPRDYDGPLLRAEPVVGDFAILNGVMEVRSTLSAFPIASQVQIEHHAARLHEGVTLLESVWPDAYASMQRHVSAVVLLDSPGYARSHSPASLCGMVALTTGATSTIGDLLCHEASHVRMHAINAFDPLVTPDENNKPANGFKSPWRSDLRPMSGLLLGVHAFLNVCGWYQRLARLRPNDAAIAARIHDRQAGHVRVAFRDLSQLGVTTSLGTQLMAEFAQAVDSLPILDISRGG